MKRNLGPLSLLTAGLILLNSVPAFPQQQVASVTRNTTADSEAKKTATPSAEEYRAEISRLGVRKSALQKYIATVDPVSNDFLVASRSIREIDLKLKELSQALQTVAAPPRKLTLAPSAYLGKYRAEIKLKIDPSYAGDIKLTVLDRLGSEVSSRTLSNLMRGINDYTTIIDLADGQNIVVATSPDDTESSNSLVLLGGDAQPALETPPPATVSTRAAAFTPPAPLNSTDPYPVLLSLGGMVVSQQAQNFNQADPFFGFIAGYTSEQRTAFGGWRWNLRFQGIFTAAARTAEEGEETDDTEGGGNGNGEEADPFKFIASRKSFDIDTHAWIDFFDGEMFSIGPYGAWGASTVMDKNELQGEAIVADTDEDGGADTGEVTTEARSDNDLKQFRELGMLMNLRVKDDQNKPKLHLQAIIAHGWYEALKDLDRDTDSRKRFIGKLRIFPEGLSFNLDNKAITPMFGVEVNAGPGPDQIKFFTGFAARLKGFTFN